jgi:16S rRNA (uracil1498-N3)-methyltransferase
MELFFADPENIEVAFAQFDSFESRHVLKTLRKKTGEQIHFTDGLGKLYQGTITATHPLIKLKYALLEEVSPPAPMLSVGFGFIKPNRMDFVFEKGTELGINKFYLFASKNSNYYTDNIKRWEKITRQAIKQSLRYFLPEIICIKNFQDFITYESAENRVSEIYPEIKMNKNVLFIIGPEGGFTEDEINLAVDQNCRPVSFGKFRLRAETAVLHAAAFINLFRN